MLVHGIPNPSGDPVRDIERQYECSGFQLAITGCHDDCGRGGRTVDSDHGQLHETCEFAKGTEVGDLGEGTGRLV